MPSRRNDRDNGSASTSRILLVFFTVLGLLYVCINAYSERLLTKDELNQQSSIQITASTSASASASSTKIAPDLLPTDKIYKNARTVFVIPEYKLIFFSFPKVACSEWKRFFMRINHNENWCKIRGFDAHDPTKNQISTLADYPTEIASAMMTSPVWTRAAIVREPKERVLSAFLDKAVKETYFKRKCCEKIPLWKDKKLCRDNSQDFKTFLTFVKKYPKECFDVHWEAQVLKVDSKWWPYIDFVGHQDNLREDAQTILESLTSTRDPVPDRSAWERYGTKGWGNDNELCEKRPYAFLEENSSAHNLDTGSKLLEWYTPELEKMVEEQWAVEWEQEEANFPTKKLFSDDDE